MTSYWQTVGLECPYNGRITMLRVEVTEGESGAEMRLLLGRTLEPLSGEVSVDCEKLERIKSPGTYRSEEVAIRALSVFGITPAALER